MAEPRPDIQSILAALGETISMRHVPVFMLTVIFLFCLQPLNSLLALHRHRHPLALQVNRMVLPQAFPKLATRVLLPAALATAPLLTRACQPPRPLVAST